MYDLAFDQSGNLYVVDTQGARIIVVNPEGGFVRQFGGVGGGPGEFDQHNTSSIRIAVLRDGRVSAFDQRFSVFGPEGEFERTVRMGGNDALIFMPRLDVDRRGEGVLATGAVRILDNAILRGRADGTIAEPEFRHVVRMDLTGDQVVVDTVAHAWLPPGEATGFIPPLVAGALPDGGVAYTDSSAYAIKVTGADGTRTGPAANDIRSYIILSRKYIIVYDLAMEEFITLNWWHLGIGLGALAVLAIVADWMKSRVIAKTLGRVASEAQISLDDGPFNRMVLRRLAPIVPALVVYYGIVPALGVTRSEVQAGAEAEILILFWTLVRRLSAAYIALTIARTLAAVLESFGAVYHRTSPASVAKPIKSYMQVATLLIYVIAGIVIVAVLLGRSPVVFLSGVGALAAVLMLVFRNTLLSLAASIQITSNDIIRIGDWVEVPHANANGTVVDIDLHMVRVQNWDKTISTIPTHKLTGDSFKNWRAMSESGGRRVKRAILIDVNTVRFLADEEVVELSGSGPSGAQAREITNLEAFRAHVEGYLRAHPKTHREMTLMVRQLAPGPHGAPIEIYCFSNDTEWLGYEAFQSEIFDHLFAILPRFGLRAFQERSGSDLPRREEPVGSGDG